MVPSRSKKEPAWPTSSVVAVSDLDPGAVCTDERRVSVVHNIWRLKPRSPHLAQTGVPVAGRGQNRSLSGLRTGLAFSLALGTLFRLIDDFSKFLCTWFVRGIIYEPAMLVVIGVDFVVLSQSEGCALKKSYSAINPPVHCPESCASFSDLRGASEYQHFRAYGNFPGLLEPRELGLGQPNYSGNELFHPGVRHIDYVGHCAIGTVEISI